MINVVSESGLERLVKWEDHCERKAGGRAQRKLTIVSTKGGAEWGRGETHM